MISEVMGSLEVVKGTNGTVILLNCAKAFNKKILPIISLVLNQVPRLPFTGLLKGTNLR